MSDSYADDYYSIEDPRKIFICQTQGFPDRKEIDHTLLCGHTVSFPMGTEYASYGHGSKPHHVPCRTCLAALADSMEHDPDDESRSAHRPRLGRE